MDKIPSIYLPLFAFAVSLYLCVKNASSDSRSVANILFAILFALAAVVAFIAFIFAVK